VLVFAAAAFVGFAVLALVEFNPAGGGRTSGSGEAPPAQSPAHPAAKARAKARIAVPHQDPQDRSGTSAARAARRELRSHRALQHIPYRDDGVSIDLVGAKDGLALLRVNGGDFAAARRGWRRFLDRYDDEGQGYRPIFTGGGRDG
jgi:hypothetical protein